MASRTSSTASSPASTACGRAEPPARSSFCRDDVDRDDRAAAPASAAPSSAASPTPPSPKIATLSPGATCALLTHGADAGEHGAAEQRGDVERQRRVDLHGRARGDDDVLGERRHAEVVVRATRPPPVAPAAARPRAACPAAFAAAPGSHSAGAPVAARPAAPAGGDEREHDVVADLRSRRPPADLDDLAGGLVAERHRHHARPRAVDHRQIASGRGPPRATRTSSSPGPGGSSSSSATSSGRDSAYGAGRPISRRTAARTFMRRPSATRRSRAVRIDVGDLGRAAVVAVDEHVHEPSGRRGRPRTPDRNRPIS